MCLYWGGNLEETPENIQTHREGIKPSVLEVRGKNAPWSLESISDSLHHCQASNLMESMHVFTLRQIRNMTTSSKCILIGGTLVLCFLEGSCASSSGLGCFYSRAMRARA